MKLRGPQLDVSLRTAHKVVDARRELLPATKVPKSLSHVFAGDRAEPRSPHAALPRLEAHGEKSVSVIAARQQALAPTTIDAYRDQLLTDLANVKRFLLLSEPAVSVFGTARSRAGDADFANVLRLGEELALHDLRVRTGAGPGAMEAAPMGYLSMLAKIQKGEVVATPIAPLTQGLSPYAAKNQDDKRTQGVAIFLPNEQATSPSIEQEVKATLFPFRKLGLYENSRGLIVSTGGFGTMEEWLEVLALRAEGWHNDPIAFYGTDFYDKILSSIVTSFGGERGLLNDSLWQGALVSDDPREVVRFIGHAPNVKGIDVDLDDLEHRMTTQLVDGFDIVKKLPKGATFIGAQGLSAQDPALDVMREASRLLTEAEVPLRVISSDNVGRAVADGARAANPQAKVSAFLRTRDAVPGDDTSLDVKYRFQDHVAQRETVLQGTSALVVTAADERALALLFNVLTEVQTHKRPRIPILLVGADEAFTKIMEATWDAMLTSTPAFIHPDDKQLVQITSDPRVIAKTIIDAQ